MGLLKKLLKHEKLILIGLPCLSIVVALAIAVPVLISYNKDAPVYVPVEEEAIASFPEAVPIEQIEDEVKTGEPVSPEYTMNMSGPISYIDCNGREASSIGIDLSYFNGDVNFDAVKKAGIDFVVIRIGGRGWGTGALYYDTCFLKYLHGAKAAGLKVGVYFYSAAVNRTEALQEAGLVTSMLDGITLDLPVFFDTEFTGDYPKGRCDGLTIAQRLEIIRAFSYVIENSGYEAGLYASESFVKTELDYNSVSDLTVWIASYTENNALPDFEDRFDIWQFTDNGRIPGVNGNVDINVVF